MNPANPWEYSGCNWSTSSWSVRGLGFRALRKGRSTTGFDKDSRRALQGLRFGAFAVVEVSYRIQSLATSLLPLARKTVQAILGKCYTSFGRV